MTARAPGRLPLQRFRAKGNSMTAPLTDPSGITIRLVPLDDTFALRKAVLRPWLTIEEARASWEGFEEHFHVGALQGGQVVSTAGFVVEAHPAYAEAFGPLQWHLRGMASDPGRAGAGIRRRGAGTAAGREGAGLGGTVVQRTHGRPDVLRAPRLFAYRRPLRDARDGAALRILAPRRRGLTTKPLTLPLTRVPPSPRRGEGCAALARYEPSRSWVRGRRPHSPSKNAFR